MADGKGGLSGLTSVMRGVVAGGGFGDEAAECREGGVLEFGREEVALDRLSKFVVVKFLN